MNFKIIVRFLVRTCVYISVFHFTAFIPFILIVAFNINTFVTIHRRQKLSPRLRNSRSQSINHQAARQSYVLFAILVVFGFCHIPRFILGKVRLFWYIAVLYLFTWCSFWSSIIFVFMNKLYTFSFSSERVYNVGPYTKVFDKWMPCGQILDIGIWIRITDPIVFQLKHQLSALSCYIKRFSAYL